MIRRQLLRFVDVLDWPLIGLWALLALVSALNMYSVAFDFPGRFDSHARNLLMCLGMAWVVAQVKPQWLMRIALPVYVIGVVMLLLVALFGETRNGSTRWLNIGITSIQPSEIAKISTPLMLAWFVHQKEGVLTLQDWAVAVVILVIPFGLIVMQPDLGTSLLVFSSGFFVLYFAGLSWRLLWVPTVLLVLIIVGLVIWGDDMCQPGVDWHLLRSYQKDRVCTLLDPGRDPLGKGFHTIQSMIAVGSGGALGKGWMQGTQTHLEFVPERTTDFIFAGFAEEVGLVGVTFLLLLYALITLRGLWIASHSKLLFGRFLVGSLSLMLFVYMFVNLGMVNGLLPVVGLPLPWMSYGGTAMLTLGMALGMMSSISRSSS